MNGTLQVAAAQVPRFAASTKWQLYLPKAWSEDVARCQKAGIPKGVNLATKPTMAPAQIEGLLDQGAPRHCARADADCRTDTAFRERRNELGLVYGVGVTSQVHVWPPGPAPLLTAICSGRGNVPTRQRLGEAAHQRPQPMKELAHTLPVEQWQSVKWQEGSSFTLCSRFARVRVRAAHRDHQRDELRPEQWVLIVRPETNKEPMKYGLSTLSQDRPIERMVLAAKMGWRIERDYQNRKQDLGLGDCEGRGWSGFHHHARLATVAYGVLMAQRLRHPEAETKRVSARIEETALPARYKPRGTPAHAAPRTIVHHALAAAYRRRLAQDAAKVPVLPARKRKATLVTQQD